MRYRRPSNRWNPRIQTARRRGPHATPKQWAEWGWWFEEHEEADLRQSVIGTEECDRIADAALSFNVAPYALQHPKSAAERVAEAKRREQERRETIEKAGELRRVSQEHKLRQQVLERKSKQVERQEEAFHQAHVQGRLYQRRIEDRFDAIQRKRLRNLRIQQMVRHHQRNRDRAWQFHGDFFAYVLATPKHPWHHEALLVQHGAMSQEEFKQWTHASERNWRERYA